MSPAGPEGPPTTMSDRRREAVLAGYRGDAAVARALLVSPEPAVRATALGALARLGGVTAADLAEALGDPDPGVRSRACEVAAAAPLRGADLRPLLADSDPGVAEQAAWALGEMGAAAGPALYDLARMATGHDDPLCREAAVAALGALGAAGELRGLPSILAATTDRPAVRRRAVIALAPFEGPDVEAAIDRALADRDWQVRQAAEVLREEP